VIGVLLTGVTHDAVMVSVVVGLLLIIVFLLMSDKRSSKPRTELGEDACEDRRLIPTEKARSGAELWEEQHELLSNLDCGDGAKQNPFHVKRFEARIARHIANQEWDLAEEVCSEGLQRDPGNVELVAKMRSVREQLREKRSEEYAARHQELRNTRIECALHGKQRQLLHMIEQPDGTYHCKPEAVCEDKQVVCAVHGKSRARVLMFQPEGHERSQLGWECRPGHSCIRSSREGGRGRKKKKTICFAYYSHGECPNPDCEFDHSQVRDVSGTGGLASEWREQTVPADDWREQAVNDTAPWEEEWDEEGE